MEQAERKLQEDFTSAGFTLSQIERTELKKTRLTPESKYTLYGAALFRQHSNGITTSYEVAIIRTREGGISGTIAGKDIVIPPGEYYPANSEWGKLAWSFSSLAAAKEEYENLKKFLKKNRIKT